MIGSIVALQPDTVGHGTVRLYFLLQNEQSVAMDTGFGSPPREISYALRLFGLMVLFATSAYAADWTKEPAGYRRLPFGANQAAAMLTLGNLNRCTSDQGGGILTCADTRNSFSIGHANVKEHLFFPQDSFAGVALDFSSDDYAFLRSVFIEKYGNPTREGRSPFSTKGGGVFENEHLEWEGRNVVITLQHFYDSVEESHALIATTGFLRAQAVQNEEDRRRAVKSF